MKKSGILFPKEKDKPRKKKPKSLTKLKKELDALVSQYVRRIYADDNGYVACYTCDRRMPWKEIQNGHLVSRYYTNTRFDLRNCRPQCYVCNCIRNGMTPQFSEKLEKELGTGITKKLYKEAQKVVIDFPYQKWIEHYKEEIKKLNAQD